LVEIGCSTSSDLELDERKSNSSSDDSFIFLSNSRRFALRVEGMVPLASFFIVTNVVLPKSSQSFPGPIFGAEVSSLLQRRPNGGGPGWMLAVLCKQY